MTAIVETDLCVVGGGAVAAQVALAAAQLGARVVLAGEPAVDGAVILRVLVEAGQAVAAARAVGAAVTIDWLSIKRRAVGAVSTVAATIAPSRLEGLGVHLLPPGQFVGAAEIVAGGRRVKAKRFVVVPGPGRPAADMAALSLAELPPRLVVAGGGAAALALAQALRRFGSAVSLRAPAGLLPGLDAELAELVSRRLAADGVDFATDRAEGDDPVLEMPEPWPALAGLGLEKAGIAWGDQTGIVVDGGWRSSNRRVWAVPFGLALHPNAIAAAVLRGALLRLPGRMPPPVRLVLGDPALAQIGLDEAAAARAGIKFRLLRWQTEDGGLIKVVTDRRFRVLGAGIVAAGAAELIQPWGLAVARRLSALALTEAPPPSPSRADSNRQAAASALMPLLLGGKVQRWVRLLLRFTPPPA